MNCTNCDEQFDDKFKETFRGLCTGCFFTGVKPIGLMSNEGRDDYHNIVDEESA